MTKSMPLKRNLSSMQVLKTLKVLLEGNYTMHEILEKLNNNEDGVVFNSSVVSKYINTCRFCGLDIQKIQCKYYVINVPFGMRLSAEESDLLNKMNSEALAEMSARSFKIFRSFIEKINRYANKKISRVEKQNINFTFEIFERAIANKRKVKLIMKNNKEISGIPITIFSANEKIFLDIFSSGKKRSVDIKKVAGVEVSDESFIGYYDEQSVVFKLKNKLAKRYEIREEEKILVFGDNEITVSNKCRDTESLLSRLMRYDDQCEVTKPFEVREDIRLLINNTLKNYGIE